MNQALEVHILRQAVYDLSINCNEQPYSRLRIFTCPQSLAKSEIKNEYLL